MIVVVVSLFCAALGLLAVVFFLALQEARRVFEATLTTLIAAHAEELAAAARDRGMLLNRIQDPGAEVGRSLEERDRADGIGRRSIRIETENREPTLGARARARQLEAEAAARGHDIGG